MKLEIEVTQELYDRLQERADMFAVKISDVATMVLAAEVFSAKKAANWADNILEVAVPFIEGFMKAMSSTSKK